MTGPPLADDIEQLLLFVADVFDAANISYAFGGAIALAFCTRQPRGTSDLDVNVFVDVADAERVLALLESRVRWTTEDLARIHRDEQVRLWSVSGYAIDLFFPYAELHAVARRRVHLVDFAGRQIPVLECTDLAVFKSMFDRTKDWADIEAALAAGSIDVRRLRSWITRLVGHEDHRHASLDRAVAAVREGRV